MEHLSVKLNGRDPRSDLSFEIRPSAFHFPQDGHAIIGPLSFGCAGTDRVRVLGANFGRSVDVMVVLDRFIVVVDLRLFSQLSG